MVRQEQANISRRLKTISGHLRAVTTMVEKGDTCDQVLHQLNAIQAALNAVTRLLLSENLAECESIIKHSKCFQERAQALDYLTLLYYWAFEHN